MGGGGAENAGQENVGLENDGQKSKRTDGQTDRNGKANSRLTLTFH